MVLFLYLICALSIFRFDAVLGYTFPRLDKNNSALLVIDHQVGLFSLVKDMPLEVFRNNMLGHVAIAQTFELPVIISSSSETGPNGPIPSELLEIVPNATRIQRNGEINAWDNEEFRSAVVATGKKQMIIAGVVTEVCTAFCALSLREAGYEVWANADASGTLTLEAARDANQRMRDAGVNVVSALAIVADLMRDWRDTPGTLEVSPYFSKYIPAYGFIGALWQSAIDLNGGQ